MVTAAWLAGAALSLAWPVGGRTRLRLVGLRERLGPARAAGARPRRRSAPVTAVVSPAGLSASAVSSGVLAALAGGPAVGLAAAVTVVVVLRVVRAGSAARRSARDDRDLSGSLRLLGGELAAGSDEAEALTAAAALAGPLAPDLHRAAAQARRGGDVASALLGGEHPGRLAPLARAWRVRAECGASLVTVIARVEHDTQRAISRRRETAAALAGPRSSAGLLAGLPILGLALGTAMGAHPVQFLFGPGAGRLILVTGVVLDAAGVLWTLRLVGGAQRS